MPDIEVYRKKYEQLLPELSERARRLVVAADAQALGWGGISFVRRASGISEVTIRKGIRELEAGVTVADGHVRQYGGGRKLATQKDPGLTEALLALVQDSAQGDPQSPLLWTHLSSRTLARELQRQNHPVSHPTVQHFLKDHDFRLQANKKSKEGTDHPDRDAQFHHLNDTAKAFLDAGDPVISVDTKKKELVGNFKNPGQSWLPSGHPIEVKVHDFPDKKLGKAVPYGIYDLAKDQGYVNVGINHDTGEFAVASIRHWWTFLGQQTYPQTRRLLITADAGGSNGYRLRLWKKELQSFADETGLTLTICHFPPGTSKWNKIEHRLFSFITANWAGRPLTSYEVIVNLIGATTNQAGLKVYAMLDEHEYTLHQKVSDAEMKTLLIQPDIFHGEWNYSIVPRCSIH
ncbi:MAG: ISAzo13 family transposase [Candidatus Sericytochromatia bacterium]